MKECIVILGMHRSGTSLLTGLVSLFGAYVGADLMKPTEDNPKGYFENNKIVRLNEKILREQGSSWHDTLFVIDAIQPNDFQQYVLEAKSILEHELKVAKRCIIKDPRISLLFPVWEQALKLLDVDIKVILSYRSPIEVALSLHKRDDMTIEKGLMLWSLYFFESEKYSRQYDRLVVEYDSDIKDLNRFLTSVGEFIGVDVNQKVMEQAEKLYTPTLKHHSLPLNNISDKYPAYLVNIIKLLTNRKFNQRKKIDQLKDEYILSRDFFLHGVKEKEAKLEQANELLKSKEVKLEEANEVLKSRLVEAKASVAENERKIESLQRIIEGNETFRRNLQYKLKNADKKDKKQVKNFKTIVHTVKEKTRRDIVFAEFEARNH